MAGPAFDPNGAVRFDLARGAASDTRGARLVVVPAAAIEALEKRNADAATALATEIGRACGVKVALRLGGDGGVRNAQLEVVVSHLAGELAVAGIAAVHVERWGRAMIVVAENPAMGSDVFVGTVIGAALGAASGRDVAATCIGHEGGKHRFFVGTAKTAERVKGLAAQGKPFATIVASIQGGAA